MKGRNQLHTTVSQAKAKEASICRGWTQVGKGDVKGGRGLDQSKGEDDERGNSRNTGKINVRGNLP